MRCKVALMAKIPSNEGVYLSFAPVYNGSEENKAFFKYTPGGMVYFNIVNPATADNFEIGKEYYVDFSPASA